MVCARISGAEQRIKNNLLSQNKGVVSYLFILLSKFVICIYKKKQFVRYKCLIKSLQKTDNLKVSLVYDAKNLFKTGILHIS